jgi:putative hydrolase of the HAD superfamily
MPVATEQQRLSAIVMRSSSGRATNRRVPASRRAVLFDLDDTLFPANQFRSSGFAAVARHLAQAYELDAEMVRTALTGLSSGPARGRELQVCARRFGLPATIVGELVDMIRAHEPSLTLPRMTAAALKALRPAWRIGIVTNGPAEAQRRKVAALDLERRVDCIVYAHEHGSGAGKPDRAPFLEALRRLDVPASQAVFVGDDDYGDIFGASRVGMRTVLMAAWNTRPRGRPVRADSVVVNLRDVPRLAERLLVNSLRRPDRRRRASISRAPLPRQDW